MKKFLGTLTFSLACSVAAQAADSREVAAYKVQAFCRVHSEACRAEAHKILSNVAPSMIDEGFSRWLATQPAVTPDEVGTQDGMEDAIGAVGDYLENYCRENRDSCEKAAGTVFFLVPAQYIDAAFDAWLGDDGNSTNNARLLR